MTVRTWLYNRMTAELLPDGTPSPFYALTAGRVFAKKTMTSSVEAHPYVVWKLGNATAEELSETVDPYRQYLQIFVHDYSDEKVADYALIDEVIVALKRLLVNQASAPDGIITIRYLETSQDLNDDTLGTVFKYVRFQVIVEE